MALRSGILICVSLIFYFILMRYFNMVHITALRFLNVFILAGGLVFTFRQYRVKTRILNTPYFEGISLGVATTLVSVTLFAIFVYVYFSRIDPVLLLSLKEHTVMMGSSLSAITAAASVLIEGLCSGIILSFTLMQYYKSGFYKTLSEKREAGISV